MDRGTPAQHAAAEAEALARQLAPTELAELAEARPMEHFTLHFVESAPAGELGAGDGPYFVEVRVGGQVVGQLALYESEWANIWRALVGATPSFDRWGISLHRTGKFR